MPKPERAVDDALKPAAPGLPIPSDLPPGWLRPAFSAARVGALMTSRHGGVSQAPYDSLNLRPGLGDDDAAVAENRARVALHCAGAGVLLQQVHGTACVMLTGAALPPMPVADASGSTTPGVVCEIQVADCLPVLLADRHGRGVAVAHAGWRGLAGGVVQGALAQLCEASGAAPHQVEAWLGPCIGPRRFEVGADVLHAFAVAAAPPACFVPLPRSAAAAGTAAAEPGRAGPVADKWLADLPGLARHLLVQAGVASVAGNDGSPAWCTVENTHYYSYRRELGRTGRQAAYIWLRA
ncbi:MAG: peptidoglycan editing factor PgeF [Pseudomonadota bacterium]